ncbi:MAG TPA: radical SAM protein [Candidatus Acidoferrum sp.]|nr:radical SAM protein [Candidatus Acidoferrum sp.]
MQPQNPGSHIMTTLASKTWDMLRLITRGGPALCNVAVTNACNAACDFCNFARGKVDARNLRWIDAGQFGRALDILRRRDIRYISFFGGEPLLHSRLADMVAMVVERDMGPALITNGWLLASQLDKLAAAGLKTIYISIDAATIARHEVNRGLPGLGQRIRTSIPRMREFGITPLAQVTMSKLLGDYRQLAPLLRELGFDAVAFSYPQTARLGSSSLAWSSNSQLMNFSDREMAAAFDSVDSLRSEFPVNNPSASVADMKRHLRGQQETFACYGGFKSFYMDWNYDMWRCDFWSKKISSVWDFPDAPPIRDGCTACVADCYRDSSVMLHFAVSLGDTLHHLRQGRFRAATKTLLDRRNLISLGAVLENAHVLTGLARLG